MEFTIRKYAQLNAVYGLFHSVHRLKIHKNLFCHCFAKLGTGRAQSSSAVCSGKSVQKLTQCGDAETKEGLSLIECVHQDLSMRLCNRIKRDSSSWDALCNWVSVAARNQTRSLLQRLPCFAVSWTQARSLL